MRNKQRTEVLHSGAVAAADGSIMDVRGYTSVNVQITGITTATVTFQGNVDGTNFVNVQAYDTAGRSLGSIAIANGTYICDVTGFKNFKADITSWTSGTVVVTANATVDPVPQYDGGDIFSITVDPTIQTSAYSLKDLVCEKLTFSNVVRRDGGMAVLQTITVIDLDGENSELWFVLFDRDPTNTTFTLNSALTVNDTDADTQLGLVKVFASDYIDHAANSVAQVSDIGLAFTLSGVDLFVAVIINTANTYTATGDLRFKFTFLRS